MRNEKEINEEINDLIQKMRNTKELELRQLIDGKIQALKWVLIEF